MKTVLAILPLSEVLDSALYCPGTTFLLAVPSRAGTSYNITSYKSVLLNQISSYYKKLKRLFPPVSVRDALSADTKVKQILGDLIDPFLESSVFIQLYPSFDWDRVTFTHSSWYRAVFWV